MTGFRGTDDSGRVVDDLTPETLRALMEAAAASVLVENPGWGPDHSARARRHEGAEGWRVEIRGGGPDRHSFTDAPSLPAAYDILRSWAAADGWWQEAFSWQPVRRA